MTKKLPINCVKCGAYFYRKGRGGREKHCSVQCRFWDKVEVSEDCFKWKSTLFKQTGYGQFALTPTTPVNAHRMAWELTHGAIPDGMFVLHKCDNRLCVRPEHLFLGTQADNMKDMAAKGRHIGARGRVMPMEERLMRGERMKQVWAERRAA